MVLLKNTVILIFLSLNAVSFGWSQNLKSTRNFQQVTENVFRSGRPAGNELKLLKNSHGIQSVLNIEDNMSMVRQEQQTSNRIGIKFISKPMATHSRPSDQQVNQILEMLQDTRNFPILIHCMHGQDRTGLIMGLYRVEVQGWSPQKAYKEMLELGYHPKYKALDDYFRERTGYL